MKSKGCNDIMDKKVIGGYCVCFLLIIILLLFMISGNSSPYGIKKGDIHLEVQDNGLLKVQEVYTYTIKETVDTINRTIERDNGENISNLKVYTSGAYSEFNIEENSNSTNITTFLYKDESKNQKINNKEITVVYEYDLTQALKLYNDVGIFQYKLYDNKEVVPINNLSFKINYPSKEGVNFWINPYDVAENTKFHWENSSLIIENISTNFMTNNIEFSSTIPKNEFSINNTYATIIDDTKAEDITKAQENYENNYKRNNIVLPLFSVIEIMSLLLPIGVYIKYRRKPKLTFKEIEEPPTDDKPIFVNSIIYSTQIIRGRPNINALKAVILDLIEKNVLSYNLYEDTIILKIITNKKDLLDYELEALNLLKLFEDENNCINLNKIKIQLKKGNNSKIYTKKIKKWEENYQEQNDISKFIDNTYLDIFFKYGKILLIILIIPVILNLVAPHPFFIYNIITGIIMIIVYFILGKMLSRVNWTEYGMEYYLKWMAFRKYLNDLSLIKEHPPESKNWNKYIIYATALGCEDCILKSMKDLNLKNNLYNFYHIGGIKLLNRIFE